MKPISDALRALLKTGRFYEADLFAISLVSGTVLRYTTADINIAYAGDTYLCNGPRFNRSKGSWKTGLDVSDAQIQIYPRPTDMIGGISFLRAVRAGVFDGGTVTVYRCFMPTMGDTSPGAFIMIAGRIGDIQAGRSSIVMPVKSRLELLNRQFPANLYTSTCGNVLYDPRCTLIKASFSTTVTALAGATTTAVPVSNSRPAGYYAQGTAEFVGGVNDGVLTTIKGWDGHTLTLGLPLTVAPTAGDQIIIAPGCDHTRPTCLTKFGNLANYRGFDFVPVPETAI